MPKTGINKVIHGEKVELTARQVKSEIMRIRGWDTTEYQRQYDILRNKLRAYEAFQRSVGEEVNTNSPLKFLYGEAKSIERYKGDYHPSAYVSAVRATTSVSSGKALQKAIASPISRAVQGAKIGQQIDYYFANFIRDVPKAQEIMEKIKDPLKQMAALKALAKELHAREDKENRTIASNPDMPFGQTSGSTAPIDFDLSPWL